MSRPTFVCLLLLLALTALVTAQNIPFNPACANTCAQKALKDAGCSADDKACQCKGDRWSNLTLDCAQKSCPVEDYSSAIGAVRSYCEAQNAPPPSLSSVTSASATGTGGSNPATTSPSGSVSGSSSKATPATGLATTPAAAQSATTITPAVIAATNTPLPAGSLPSSSVVHASDTTIVFNTVTASPNSNAASTCFAVPLSLLLLPVLGVFGGMAIM